MPRRRGIRGGSTRADGTLVQGAATAFGPTASVGAGVAQGFQSTFMDTFKYVKAEKDKDYARVEEEFYKTFDQVEALQKDYNVLDKDQQNLLQPWLRNKKQELYDIKKKMQNAPRNQRDALRIEMNDILSTVQRSAGSMEGMSNYFNELSTLAENGGVSDANGLINPEKAKNTFNFALGKSYDFDQKTGTFNYETEIYQKAVKTADDFFVDTAKAYEYGKKTGVKLTEDEIDIKRQYYNKNLSENDVVSLLFDDFAFNDDGYYDATMKSSEVTTGVRSEYKRNFEMLKKGRGTKEYKDAIKFFKEQVTEKLTEGYKSRSDAGADEFKAPDAAVTPPTAAEVKEQRKQTFVYNTIDNAYNDANAIRNRGGGFGSQKEEYESIANYINEGLTSLDNELELVYDDSSQTFTLFKGDGEKGYRLRSNIDPNDKQMLMTIFGGGAFGEKNERIISGAGEYEEKDYGIAFASMSDEDLKVKIRGLIYTKEDIMESIKRGKLSRINPDLKGTVIGKREESGIDIDKNSPIYKQLLQMNFINEADINF